MTYFEVIRRFKYQEPSNVSDGSGSFPDQRSTFGSSKQIKYALNSALSSTVSSISSGSALFGKWLIAQRSRLKMPFLGLWLRCFKIKVFRHLLGTACPEGRFKSITSQCTRRSCILPAGAESLRVLGLVLIPNTYGRLLTMWAKKKKKKSRKAGGSWAWDGAKESVHLKTSTAWEHSYAGSSSRTYKPWMPNLYCLSEMKGFFPGLC